jgi:hypothetical protein
MVDVAAPKNPPKEEEEAKKAAADARTAEATAAKTEHELAELESPLAKEKREAEDKKAIAEAEKATATAQQGQVTALLPDLSKVERGSLAVDDAQALFGSALAQRALTAAAKTVATEAGEALKDKGGWRILVTSDAQLATTDSVYLDVSTGLDQLTTAATRVLAETSPGRVASMVAMTPFAAAAAIATALPGALSLLSAHRTLSSASVTVGNLAAAAATAGALTKLEEPSGEVVHDDVRTLPSGGPVHAKLSALDQHRQDLIGRKIALEDEKARTTKAITVLEESVKDLAKKVEATEPGQKPALQVELDRQKEELANHRQRLSESTVRIGLVDSVTAAIDTFTTSLRTIAEGATRSPLATAVLREQLHPAPETGQWPPRFTHVMFVQAEPGSTQQVINDRPLWLKDKFSAMGIVNVTYMLVELPGSEIRAAGSASGKAVVKGTIGGDVKIEAEA